MNSLAIRLAAAFVGLVAAVAIVFAAIGFATASSGATNQVDRFLRERADEVIRGDRGRPDPDTAAGATVTADIEATNDDNDDNNNDNDNAGDRPRRNDRSSRGSVDDDAIVQSINADGQVGRSTGIDLPVGERDIQLARSGTDATWLRTIEIDDDPFRIITAASLDGGAVLVARALNETNTTIGQIQRQLALAVPLVALAAAAAGLILARRITGPLRSLATTVDTVASTGDLGVPIEVRGDDEVGRLAAGFDNLLRSLSRSRSQQQQLVQDAAHELRTPLTSVKANVEFLAAAPDLEPEIQRETLTSVQGELRELSRLVDEIVDVATDRFVPQQFARTDLADAAAEAVERFRARNRNRVVETDLAPTMIRGDHDSLVRAIGNLLSNADKYSPPDAPVAVRIEAGTTLSVIDRGPGIPVDERDRVFDRFYRSDEARAQPGSGLGLAIVASIVEAHGGTVGVADNPAGGSIVSFTLPS